jgi:nicotinamide-nucleotide amidase
VRAAVLVTGDEVLGGRVPERNAAYLARSLAPRGVRVVRTLVVGDSIEEIGEGLRQLLALDVDMVCTSGGLGPTYDDLTMAAVADVTGRPLAVDEAALALVESRSRAVSLRVHVDPQDLERMRRKQATLPQGASVLPPIGTAPGCALDHDGTLIVVLPGPPYELQGMWDVALRAGPVADRVATAEAEPTQTFRLWSIYEAQLVPVLEPLGSDVLDTIGTYTREGELEIVVPASLAATVEALLREHFGTYLFATDDRHVESIVADALMARGQTLAVGESCTGGGLGARLTALPGSSRWFVGGAITYSNEAKVALLGVDPDIISTHGAVSRECVEQMAVGARRVTGADWGVGITGIAGPDGGSDEKPVGLVWIGVAGPDDTVVAFEHRLLRSDRETVRRRALTAALHRLRLAIEG